MYRRDFPTYVSQYASSQVWQGRALKRLCDNVSIPPADDCQLLRYQAWILEWHQGLGTLLTRFLPPRPTIPTATGIALCRPGYRALFQSSWRQPRVGDYNGVKLLPVRKLTPRAVTITYSLSVEIILALCFNRIMDLSVGPLASSNIFSIRLCSTSPSSS